ncbi:hypothetical protein LTR84_010365 [Exophiala bonariae]|uniref:ABC transporter domain-containing protein n=1 Tax=Exophiala bonariae TaxID=1690606 RepID=A0AAV9MWA7_9EURO|nr:hypothetical protein LTR84_010365 [Exophiala bonariae]
MLQVCYICLKSALIITSLLHHGIASSGEAVTPEEAQPLLGTEQPTANREEDREKYPEELDREKIRDRPVWQYLASFKILLPCMYPSSGQQKIHFVGICTCTFLGGILETVTPLCLGGVIDLLDGFHMPWRAIALYGSLTFANSDAGIFLVRDWLSAKMNIEMTTNLTQHSYNAIMNLSADFHDSKKTNITYSIIHNGQQVIDLFNDVLFVIFPMLLDVIAAASVLTYMFGPYMLYTITLTTVVFYWIMFTSLKQKTALRRLYVDAFHDADHQMSESFINWNTVSQFGQIQYEIGRYRDKSRAVQVLAMKSYFYSMITRAVRQLVPTMSFIAACAIAALQIIHHQHKISDFVVLITYWGQLIRPLGFLASKFTDIGNKSVSTEKLLVLLEKNPAVCDEELANPFIFRGGAIEFENVTFSYDRQRTVTDGISFRAEPDKTTAPVGLSGGGKSTIFNLLYRSYDIEQGRILIDGQDIKTLQMASFRKHIATVSQNPQVFNMTITENIKYPNPNASDESAIGAAKAAGLHSRILTFTHGYREKVGERGTKLSGGKLQRLAIARAILKDSDILLLDEATCSLDSITEAQIQVTLKELSVGKTVLVIAHRLGTIRHADRIFVVDDGRVKEAGRHDELITRKGGLYAKMWREQVGR